MRTLTPAAAHPEAPESVAAAPQRGRPAAAGTGEPLDGAPRRVAVWPLSTAARLAILGVLAALALALLWMVQEVLTPFVVAVVIAYVLRPIVAQLEQRAGMPRPVASLAVILAVVVLLGGAIVLLMPTLAREARGLAAALPRLVLEVRRTMDNQPSISVLGATVEVAPLADEVSRSLVGGVRELSMHVVDALVATVEAVLKGVLSLVIAFYLLLDFGRFRRWVRGIVPPAARTELGVLAADVDRMLGQFLRAEVLLVLIMSTVTWVALSLLGIRYALVLGILTGLLELIPIFGPIAASIPPIALALFLPSPHGWHPAANAGAVAATYFVLRHAEDYFVIPQVLGRAVELHPLIAMFAAFAGLQLGGILGMFLAVPTAAVARVLLVYLYRKLVPAWEAPGEAAGSEAAGLPAPAAARRFDPPNVD